MPLSRHLLPQLTGRLCLTDGGLETTLVYHDGVNLPCFAAFPLLETPEGRDRLFAYFRPYLELARKYAAGFIIDTPTWRANSDWGKALGYSADDLARISGDAVRFVKALAGRLATERTPVIANGVVGPRGDGYKVEGPMTVKEAEGYHDAQVAAFAEAGADMVSAITMTHPEEAIGIAKAAAWRDMPVVISFTVETDGHLPSGHSLRAAIEQVDTATGSSPIYYMINCAHPLHFEDALAEGGAWRERIRGIRANASTKSHAELDAATELDVGDSADLALRYGALRRRLKDLCVVGGCCGTDHRHLAAICETCLEQAAA